MAPSFDDEGREVTPQRAFGYDTLVIAVGSQSNDFGTPGVGEHAMKLETQDDARRFHARMVNACIRAHAQSTPLRPEQLKVAIIGAGATGVELAAELHRTTREVVAYGLDRVDPDKDIKVSSSRPPTRVLPALPARCRRPAKSCCASSASRCTRVPRSPRCCPTACAWPTAACCRPSSSCGPPASRRRSS